jgi:hypothetical protein
MGRSAGAPTTGLAFWMRGLWGLSKVTPGGAELP